ncbi:uncharacterized protein MELLADRAFT_110666 [Melampsora larici-populina 98AG31]|uniref:Uncharacterized protein n=1 Tax=Melampsora larici-populina (strain 98AG31 / pathotype 3-4-7) TaxID=747676 RepID=F4S0J5_MELLP|nr:uncharacterized protein MELLADRAFT_110666 [Melampsora larici-populina 98AG31]EGG01857.1 hypothetical protein MELLADRAFT_110666 [Melampsora larici-populina 98AG31]
MLTSKIWLIHFTQVVFIPVIFAGFWDDKHTVEFYSDIIDAEPSIETSFSKPDGLSMQDRIYPRQISYDPISFNQDIEYGWDHFCADHYHTPDFHSQDSLFPSQESRDQTEKEMELETGTTQVRSISPRENVSIGRMGKSFGSTNTQPLNEPIVAFEQPLMVCQDSETMQVRSISARKTLPIDIMRNRLENTNQDESTETLIPSERPVRVQRNIGTKHKLNHLPEARHQKKHKENDTPQENMQLEKKLQDINHQKHHHYAHEITLSSVLQWQCRILLAKRYNVSYKIARFFNNLEKSYMLMPDHSLYRLRNFSQFHISIEKLRTSLVMGSIGALKLIVQRHIGLELMNSLILDLWEYLQQFINDELMLSPKETIIMSAEKQKRQKHNWIQPGELLEYLSNLANSSPISSKIVHLKIQDWATTTTYKNMISGIATDYQSLVEECETFYKQKGEDKTVYYKNKNKARNHHILQDNLTNTSTRLIPILSSSQLVQALKKLGWDVARSKYTVTFFSYLHSVIESNPDPEKSLYNDSKDVQEGAQILNKKMVHQAIHLAQNEVTPAFMGLLRLMHHDPAIDADSTWNAVSQSGWEFLKEYFSTWIRYLSEPDHHILVIPPGKARVLDEWFDLKVTLNYLSKKRETNTVPQGLIWFLADVWYDEMNCPESNGKQSPSFRILPPHRKVIEQRCLQRMPRKDC